MKKQQIQQQKQLSAYDRKTTFDIFHMTMEWLEKYIEVAGYYPDWNDRKQIHNNNINRKDVIGNPEKAEKSFSSQLFMFKVTLDDDPPFLRDEVKQEFYRWLNATRIDSNNCPERLKQWLFGVNEILEGRGEKIQQDVENRKQTLNSNSPEYMEQMNKVFANIQGPMQNEGEIRKALEGKTHKDIEIGSKFERGNVEQGEKAFKQIADTVSASHDNSFHFFPQQGQQTDNFQHCTNSEIIQDIRQNPRNWRIDEIIVEFDNFGRTRQEIVLIHQSARLDDYDQRTGKLNLERNAIYQANQFSAEEQAEINRALNISQQQTAQVQQQFYKWRWE